MSLLHRCAAKLKKVLPCQRILLGRALPLELACRDAFAPDRSCAAERVLKSWLQS